MSVSRSRFLLSAFSFLFLLCSFPNFEAISHNWLHERNIVHSHKHDHDHPPDANHHHEADDFDLSLLTKHPGLISAANTALKMQPLTGFVLLSGLQNHFENRLPAFSFLLRAPPGQTLPGFLISHPNKAPPSVS